MDNFIDWAIQQHRKTNHLYDKYLPYEFHLKQVAAVMDRFIKTTTVIFDNSQHRLLQNACWGHDLIEDTRTNYKDIVEAAISTSPLLGEKKAEQATKIADIIAACTSFVQGKNRAERMPLWVYEAIRNTPGARFVKLCDRTANVEYSIISNSRMRLVYKEEYPHFREQLYHDDYKVMFNHLDSIIDKIIQ